MMKELDLFDELQHEENDEEILEEIATKKREAKRTFSTVVNRRKVSRYELDEVMV
jgi:hypothetical protein